MSEDAQAKYQQFFFPVAVQGSSPYQDKGVSVFLFGDMGTWKTTWAAGWPGPCFVTVRSEGGDRSLGEFPHIAQYYTSISKQQIPPFFNVQLPLILPVRTVAEFESTVSSICRNHKEWGIRTVIIDSVTTLVDVFIDELMKTRLKHNPAYKEQVRKRGGEFMGFPEWQLCNHFLRSPRVKLGNLGLNSIWIALEKKRFKTTKSGDMMNSELESIRPLIQGETQIKLPASLDLHIHAEANLSVDPKDPLIVRSLPTYWTTKHGKVTLSRHRFGFRFQGGKLIDPEWPEIPTFRAVYQELSDYVYFG